MIWINVNLLKKLYYNSLIPCLDLTCKMYFPYLILDMSIHWQSKSLLSKNSILVLVDYNRFYIGNTHSYKSPQFTDIPWLSGLVLLQSKTMSELSKQWLSRRQKLVFRPEAKCPRFVLENNSYLANSFMLWRCLNGHWNRNVFEYAGY